MNKPISQSAPLLAWMECLSDPTRLRLLRLLERNELGVSDLCDIVQLPQSTVSRHLKILADQRFVFSRRHATTHLYRTLLDELDPAARKLWLLAREQTDTWPAVRHDDLRLQRRLHKRESETQTFFAAAARQWDQLRSQLYGQSFTLSALLSLLPENYTVADLGCGTGQVAALLAPHVNKVIAIDNSPAMLKAAQKRTAGFPNVDLRPGELRSLPIDDASCDAALILLVLTYLPDVAGALSEAGRILKPGGKLVVVDLLPHDRDDFRRQLGQQHLGFSAEVIGGLLTGAGFEDVVVEPLPPEANTKGPGLFLARAIRR